MDETANYIKARAEQSDERLAKLTTKLSEAEKIIARAGCVYVTGSYGRQESSRFSDLDAFIVSIGDPPLRRLDEIRVKSRLIECGKAVVGQDFSGDGDYLQRYNASSLIENLGQPGDDYHNTLTARLLLLLESRCLLGAEAYGEALRLVVGAYWRDYQSYRSSFKPAYLVNDILRLWRTFCVNYEARSVAGDSRARAKRKVKRYKLKHSRLLTCYSAIAYLLAVFASDGTVSEESAMAMVAMPPLARILAVGGVVAAAGEYATRVREYYVKFLQSTDCDPDELVELFLEKSKAKEMDAEASAFGTAVYQLIDSMKTMPNGRTNFLHRMIVV